MRDHYPSIISSTRGLLVGMASKTTRPDLIDHILKHVADLFSADGSAFYTYSSASDELTLIALHNLRQNLVGARVRGDQGLLGQVVKNLAPMKIDDYRTWPERVKVFEEDQYRALLEAPVLWKDELLGIIGLVRTGNAKPFSEFDADLLSIVAIHFAAVLATLE